MAQPIAQAATTPPATTPSGQRLLSLDALRGFNMLGITGIEQVLRHALVALGLGGTWFHTQLNHAAPGSGELHAYDLIMPLFLFLSGVSMGIGDARIEGKPLPPLRAALPKLLKRVAILWVAGMTIQGNLLTYDPSKWVWYSNTLQAIATGAVITWTIARVTRKTAWRIASVASLLGAYGIILLCTSAADCSREGNFPLAFDRMVFGNAHLGDQDYAWLIPSLGFGGTVMLGFLGGRLMPAPMSNWRRFGLLVAIAAGLYALSSVLGLAIPNNKHLWTPTFVCWSAACCYGLMALFHLLVDIPGWSRWNYPLRVVGANALLSYVLTELFDFRRFSDVFVRGLQPHISNPAAYECLRYGAAFLSLWLILDLLYRRGILWKA